MTIRTDARRLTLTLSIVAALSACEVVEEEEPPTPIVCDVAGDRFDPLDARAFTNEQFAALGAGRTGVAGRGTRESNAEERFVSAADGDDASDGSEAAPWRTLQHAADTVDPGTTVLVDASGDYPGGLEIVRGGTEGAYVIFTARDETQRPRILGDTARDSVVYVDASYVVFQGFEIADFQRAWLSLGITGTHPLHDG